MVILLDYWVNVDILSFFSSTPRSVTVEVQGKLIPEHPTPCRSRGIVKPQRSYSTHGSNTMSPIAINKFLNPIRNTDLKRQAQSFLTELNGFIPAA